VNFLSSASHESYGPEGSKPGAQYREELEGFRELSSFEVGYEIVGGRGITLCWVENKSLDPGKSMW
jgi:hypothetical protein